MRKVGGKKIYTFPPRAPVFAIYPATFKGMPDELQLKQYCPVLEDGILYNVASNIAPDENASRYYWSLPRFWSYSRQMVHSSNANVQ